MEEEITRAINRRADNNQQGGTSGTSQPMSIKPRIFGGNDAKRMSFDENMPMSKYGTSPLSSLLSNSPGGAWTGTSGTPNMANQGRRDSLKNLWHLQDFGTD